MIVNEQLTRESAQALLNAGIADAAAWGKQFIANPDLVARLQENGPFNELRTDVMYGGGETGYTDYPALG